MIPRPVLFALFFGSGVAALVYEVVWIRALSLVFSITVYSLTTVLCAFMAGLALGSMIGAFMADRSRRPLRVFGWLELGIGASGLLVPLLLFRLAPVYVALYDALGGGGAVFAASRFLLAFGVLLVPTTLMGVTLPLLSRAAIDRPEVAGRGAGGLYAANTLGGVTGCVLAGFLLIPQLGLYASSITAAAVNGLVAASALALGWNLRVARSGEAMQQPPRPMSGPGRLATLAYAVSGFTALGYEVLWTRALEPYTHNSTYAYSAMLATFLLGLALGSALSARAADRSPRPLMAMAFLQLALGANVLLALCVYMRFETLVPWMAKVMGGLDSWAHVLVLIFSEAGVTMLASTLLLGAMFPFVARLAVDSVAVVGRRVGSAYLANTVGSILGSLLVGFALLPWLGLRGSFVLLIAANLALAATLAFWSGGRRRDAAVATAAAGAVLVSALLLLPPDLFRETFEARYGSLLFYREEVTDTVMVTEDAKGGRVIRYADGRGTAGTKTIIEDRMYAHIPLLLHPHPRRMLQIGFGVGNTLSSALQHPLERATCVELSPGVIDAAPFFVESNRSVLEDPRVRLVIHDGRNFLLTSHERFDVIRMDPPELHTAGVVNLYTREFFELAVAHLEPNGIFSTWINAVMTPEEDIRALLRTLRSVFPYVSVWHGPARYSWVMNASLTPHDPDLVLLQQRFSDPRVRADLESIGIADPFDFLDHFVMTGSDLDTYAGTGPLVVDDHTRIDFTVPRSANAFYGIANFNTSYWLVDFMEGEVGSQAGKLFLRVVAERSRRKTPVVPHVHNYADAGYERADLEARLGRAAPRRKRKP